MADLSKILPVTLKFEGRFSNDAHDPGGATMEGITLATFRHYEAGATVAQLRAISDAEVLRIYRTGYFNPIGGDALSQGVGMVAFDYAVNSGVGAGKKALARTAALAGAARVRKISDGRLSFMHGLRTWRYFGSGWGRRVGAVEAIALRWESASPAAATVEIKASAGQARWRSVAHATISASSTATGTSAVTIPPIVNPPPKSRTSGALVAPQPLQAHFPTGAVLAVGAVALVVALVFGLLAMHSAQRAKSLTEGA